MLCFTFDIILDIILNIVLDIVLDIILILYIVLYIVLYIAINRISLPSKDNKKSIEFINSILQ